MNIINRLSHLIVGSYSRPAFPALRGAVIAMNVKVNDVSFWQDDGTTPQHIDFSKMRANKAQGVFIRGGQGSWNDRDFVINYENSEGILPRGIYWYLDPAYSPTSQAARLVALIKANGDPEMEVWVDYESNSTGSYAGWRHLSVFILEVERQLPQVHVGIYTGYYYWLDHSPNPITEAASFAWFKKYPLWLAWYTTDPGIVKIPKPWDDVLYWQHTSKGDGLASGAESLNIDESWFNGSLTMFNLRYGLGVTPLPEPEPNPDVDDVSLKSITPTPEQVTYVTVTVNAKDFFFTFTPAPVPIPDPEPDPEPVPTENLYRVAAERWSELHNNLPQPPTEGPLTQICSTTAKGGKYMVALGSDWQAFIKRWNTVDTMAKITSPKYGPSQGINDNGKLVWNSLVWPSGLALPNLVKVIDEKPGWKMIEVIMSPSTLATPETHPWLFHKVCDNRGNPILVRGSFIVCPIIGPACWVPERALIKA